MRNVGSMKLPRFIWRQLNGYGGNVRLAGQQIPTMGEPALSHSFSLVCLVDRCKSLAVASIQRREDVKPLSISPILYSFMWHFKIFLHGGYNVFFLAIV